MSNVFVEAYFKLVVEDEEYTLSDVPTRHKEKVKKLLNDRGYDDSGKLVNKE